MATTKKPKSSPKPKSMDVTSSQSPQPDHTARPIIVSNRPMIKDPMVTAGPPAPAPSTPGTSPVLPTRVAKTIVPQTETSAPEEAPKDADKPSDQPSSDTAPEVEERQIPQLVKAIQREKAAEAEATQSSGAEVSEASNTPAEPSSTQQEESSDGEDADTLDPTQDTETPEETEPTATDSESADAETSSDTLPDDATQPTDKDATTLDEAAKQQVTDGQKEAQTQEHIQQLIDQKTYYLPIKVAKKRHSLLALLLVIGLAAAAYFYMTMMA